MSDPPPPKVLVRTKTAVELFGLDNTRTTLLEGSSTLQCLAPDGSFERVEVEVGSFSETWAEIKSGLKQGERIALSLPDGESLAEAPRAESASESEIENPPAVGAERGNADASKQWTGSSGDRGNG